MSKLDEIFSRIKAEPREMPVTNTSHFDSSKHNNVYNSSVIMISIIISATIITTMSIYDSKPKTNNQSIHEEVISKKQGDEISALANLVSSCENKHYLDVYNDVRRITKTLRYREMNPEKFPIVKKMLEDRLCESK